jgi:MYXO-CTERM domain-containing protein
MAMNGVNFTWTTDPGSGSRVNAYSITLHEGGHYMGLGHSSDPSATMYFAYSGGVSSLNADDETGICALYPGGGGGAVDCTTTGCPSGQVCESGTCVSAGGGTGAVCDGCTSDAACGGGGLCLRYPDGLGYCGRACASDADCGGSNESCESVSDGSLQCVRRDASGAGSCDVGPGDPPGGGSTSPDPGTTPPPDPSLECTSSRDCADDERCDASGTCIPVATGDMGDACETSEDCVSGLCAVDSMRDETYCTSLCSESAPCPTGFSCVSAGGGASACQPDSAPASTGAGLASGKIIGGCAVVTPGTRAASDLVVFGLVVFVAGVGLRRRRRARRG